jgi:hypothetical protein
MRFARSPVWQAMRSPYGSRHVTWDVFWSAILRVADALADDRLLTNSCNRTTAVGEGALIVGVREAGERVTTISGNRRPGTGHRIGVKAT